MQKESAKTLKTETNKQNICKEKKKKRIAKHYEATTRSMTCVMRIPEGEKKRKIFIYLKQSIVIEKFPNLMSDTIPQIQEVESARKAIPMYIQYWSGLPFPTPGNLPDQGIKPVSLTSPALAGGFFNSSATLEAHINFIGY